MTSVQDKEKAQEAKELHELKQRAMKFYSENGVPGKMEEILNSMFYDNPEDAFGHVVCTLYTISLWIYTDARLIRFQ